MMQIERRDCTTRAPMPPGDKGKFHWIHDDAVDVGRFFNMRLYTCPNCGITFHAWPRDNAPASPENSPSPMP